MNFQNAQSFWWFFPIAGILIALYLLRMRRRDVQVPAVFLWPERTEEVRANTLFQRLRFSWLLLLQLLALLFVMTALARPQLKQKGLAGNVTVVVLDASASMGATDVKPSRMEVAKKMVSDMVNVASAGDRLALIEAGPSPRVAFPLSADRSKQSEGLKTVHQFDAEADMGEAMRLAAAIAGSTTGAKIVVLSDGAFEKVDDFSPGKASVTYQKIGVNGENLGIQALGTSEGPDGRLAYCGVKNFGLAPARRGVTIVADGKVVDSTVAEILPGQSWGKTVKLPRQAKIVEAKLDAGDALSADDYAVSLSDPSASVRVLLVSKGDMFLERALSLDPRVTLDKSDRLPEPERASSSAGGTYDLVVFDGVPEEPVKARGVLTLGSAGQGSPVKASGEARNPDFMSASDDPVVRGVDFDGIYIERLERVAPIGAGRVLAETKQGPLIVAATGKKRQVYVAFSPLDSDFPLSVGFPVLIGNVLDFLIGKDTSDTLAVRVGQAFVVQAGGEKQATLTSADGSSVSIPAREDRMVVRETDRVGRYRLTVGKKSKTVFATLRSPLESAIAPRQNLEIGTTSVTAVSDLTRFEDFWRALLLVALLVMGVEWWVYARRS